MNGRQGVSQHCEGIEQPPIYRALCFTMLLFVLAALLRTLLGLLTHSVSGLGEPSGPSP